MVLYYVILLATAIAIGLLVGIRRDVSYSENDLATIERASKASKLTSWTPLRNLPAAPPAPVCSQRSPFTCWYAKAVCLLPLIW